MVLLRRSCLLSLQLLLLLLLLLQLLLLLGVIRLRWDNRLLGSVLQSTRKEQDTE
jgi:hypothetical protein